MPNYIALGTGPISFLDGNEEQQEIPLSAIAFDANGQPDASAWPGFSNNTDVVKALLKQFVAQGFLKAGTGTSAVTPSLTIMAVQAGATGNGITVQFSAPSNGQETVTVTIPPQVFTGLTLATIGAALGTTPATATGLVYLSGGPGGNPPEAFTGNIAGAGLECAVPDNTGVPGSTAFTLTAAISSPDATNIQIQVTPLASPAGAFTLSVGYVNSVPGVSVSQLEGPSNPFAAAVAFNGQLGELLPVQGTATLAGGAPASGANPAVAAAATVASV